MIWLTCRQFRGQALTALVALVALAVSLLILGLAIRDSYNADIVGCELTHSCAAAEDQLTSQYGTVLSLTGALLIAVPAVIATFWGAPLVTRELEAGTHRLVWNQSVTRTRWLATKMAVIAGAAVAVTGALSFLLTWAASPYDELQGGRFAALDFASRNIAPLGYAVFAFVLGTVVGLMVRRTLPAMAITLAVFAAVQIVIPLAVRPHLQQPVTDTVTFSAAAMEGSGMRLNAVGESVTVDGYSIPGAWTLTPSATVVDASGEAISSETAERCMTGDVEKDVACWGEPGLHFTVSYQPADRYWTFQWIEFAGFLALAALLAGFGFWRIPRGFG